MKSFLFFFSNTNIQYIVHGKYVFDMLVHRHFCMENFHFSHFRLFTEDNFIVIENKMTETVANSLYLLIAFDCHIYNQIRVFFFRENTWKINLKKKPLITHFIQEKMNEHSVHIYLMIIPHTGNLNI